MSDIATRWRVGMSRQETAAGFVHTYHLTVIEPYLNRRGHAALLLSWLGACAVCGCPFVANSGRRPKALLRTCTTHRGLWGGRRAGRKTEGHANG